MATARSGHRAEELARLFADVELPNIDGVEFATMSPAEIANMLPPYGGRHPIKAILIDPQSGNAYGIASGWDDVTLLHGALQFRSGAISPDVATQAGGSWEALGNHVEPVAAACMRKAGIAAAILVINGRNPCWGTPDGTGCYYRMAEFLAAGSQLTVYNKYAADFLESRPDRVFRFTGVAD